MDLLIVGGGHASVSLFQRAEAWRSRGVSITLLSDHPYLYYSGMVPEYLGGVYDVDNVRINLKQWCHHTGITWHQGRVVRIDPLARTVTTAYGATLSYDLAALDIGASNPGQPLGDPQHMLRTKPMHQVEQLGQWLDALPEHSSKTSLVIAGGGAAGTELALNIQARLNRVAPRRCRVTVVEQASRVMPSFPKGLSQYAANALLEAGVTLYTGRRVAHRTPTHVLLNDNTRLPCTHLVWATGSTGPSLFETTGLPCTDQGFLRVNRSLQVPEAPRLFAAGDCAAIEGYEDLRRVGVHAVKQGPLLAENLDRMITHLQGGRPATHAPEEASLKRFRPYLITPLILSTGRPEGLWTAGPVWMANAAALRLKHYIDLTWMNQYRLPDESTWSKWHAAHPRTAGTHPSGSQ